MTDDLDKMAARSQSIAGQYDRSSLEAGWLRLQLRVAMAALSEEQEEALTLRFLNGEKVRTYAEVADELGITAEAARQRCQRGLEAARRQTAFNEARQFFRNLE